MRADVIYWKTMLILSPKRLASAAVNMAMEVFLQLIV